MNIYLYFYLNTAHDIVTILLTFFDIYQFNIILISAHVETHTHKHTCTFSGQEEWRQQGTGAWLGGARERILLQTKASEHEVL